MIEIGRLCVKIAGRDAGKRAVIVDILDDNHVLIDGETRRRKCNINHIEPLDESVKIKKGASHSEVKSVLKPLNIEARETKAKEKTKKPKKQRKVKEKPAEEPKLSKKGLQDSKNPGKPEPKKKEVKKQEKPKK